VAVYLRGGRSPCERSQVQSLKEPFLFGPFAAVRIPLPHTLFCICYHDSCCIMYLVLSYVLFASVWSLKNLLPIVWVCTMRVLFTPPAVYIPHTMPLQLLQPCTPCEPPAYIAHLVYVLRNSSCNLFINTSRISPQKSTSQATAQCKSCWESADKLLKIDKGAMLQKVYYTQRSGRKGYPYPTNNDNKKK
jgi:hypothetical protein